MALSFWQLLISLKYIYFQRLKGQGIKLPDKNRAEFLCIARKEKIKQIMT